MLAPCNGLRKCVAVTDTGREPRCVTNLEAHGVAQRLTRFARIIGTGIGFVYFALVCLLLGVIVFPLVLIRRETRNDREVRMQGWVHLGSRSFFRLLSFMQLADLECDNCERLARPGQLIVANHPTLIDAICIMSLLRQVDCVIKASHSRNPVLASVVAGSGYIPNTDGPTLVNDSVKRLAQGRSLVIFPEGTRSEVHGLNTFGRGAAHVALRTGLNPVPVTIRCEPATLYRGQAWRDLPVGKFRISLEVGEPILLADVLPETMPVPRAARVLTAAITDHFERRLNLAG
jgi:1-acyl-sn-glycerol-3-phosphate acyltransferase